MYSRARQVFNVVAAMAAIGAVVLVSVGFGPLFGSGRVAPAVTANGIRQVRLGMTLGQVVAVLGRPLGVASYKGSRAHHIGCQNDAETVMQLDNMPEETAIEALFQRAKRDTAVHACDADSEFKHDRHSTFTYTSPGGFFRAYPMLWVHFDKQARVHTVFAKEYDADDLSIYSVDPEGSPSIEDRDALNRLFGNQR